MAQQTKPQSAQKIGGISFNEQIVLDTAYVGVLYQFERQALEEDKTVQLTDTLLLATGNIHSIFLDPLYKERLERARKERINRSRKAKLIHIEHQNLSDILELKEKGSDYKEENNGSPLQVYKDRSKNEVSSVFNSYVNNIECTQHIPSMQQWQFIEGTDSILGYACGKATTRYAGRAYTAWFTFDIPINDGPWKFYGLPGLIMKVEDDAHIFRFEAIGIEQYKKPVHIVKDDRKYEKGTLKQFNTFVEKETSKNMASFYLDGALYMTNKKITVTHIPLELNVK